MSWAKMSSSQRQEFCVRWNSHLGSIGAAFPQLLAGQRFVDVTLACEGHTVHCHRLVLAACSSYFENILAENPCKHPVIILPSEIKLWEIQALVDFMYKGEVNVTQAGLPQLLRCAEQLRIRGLYGSDAALNLNQLKALTNKATAAAAAAMAVSSGATAAANANAANVATVGGGVSGANDNSNETDDTATNSTTTTATSSRQQSQMLNVGGTLLPHGVVVKKEFPLEQTNGANAILLQQQHHLLQQQQLQNHHHQQHLQQQQLQQQQHHQHQVKIETQTNATTSNAASDDESADDSTSNPYDQFHDYQAGKLAVQAAVSVAAKTSSASIHHDSTIEDDHNYVAHDEEDSYSATGADTEHESSANASLLGTSADGSGSFKRVRRSEASLAQAAKCVSKGQTFQTVSNLYNIPVSTIRFYMARKGILPKRKRGRGASTSASSGAMSTSSVGCASISSAVMSQALAQMNDRIVPTQ